MAKTGEFTNCTIGEGSVFEGRFFIAGSILIEGKFSGDIKTNEQVIIGDTGKVKTDIVAKKVIVAGTIIGNINALEEVVLKQTGKVLGDIITPKLNVEAGALTQGKVVILAETAVKDLAKIIHESFGKDANDIFADLQDSKKTVKEKAAE